MQLNLHTDNKNVSILKNGSRIDDLQILSTRVFDLCCMHNVTLVPVWIPRDENQIAVVVFFVDAQTATIGRLTKIYFMY